MSLERVTLFDARSSLFFFFGIIALAFISLSFEYYQYREFKTFEDREIEAKVINHYVKTKNDKTYSVLKLRFKGKTLYTLGNKNLKNLRGRTLLLRIWTQKIDFLDYIKGFYIYSYILHVKPELAKSERLSRYIASQHKESLLQELYGALFSATPVGLDLREKLSASGTAHLLAISGFHLGVLTSLILLLLTLPYRFFQERYFPYRHRRRDLFIVTALLMLGYLLFLGWVPSLLRAFVMMIIGYILYERHMKVISMQTLAITTLFLLALWPSLLFSLGFWLSISGVFYIFLFLKYFDTLSAWKMGLGIACWVYLMMLPLSLYLFESFSLVHPLSIVWSLLFFPFYIGSLLLHVIGFGGVFDGILLAMFDKIESRNVSISLSVLLLHVSISLLAIVSKRALGILLFLAISIVVFAIYQVA
ncbi:MAG: ComEC/Rec2 family competence protein [Campylobacterota bacterium]|nr:ComEC/Rec2 family competence protein [Campylobacterota bacterium]